MTLEEAQAKIKELEDQLEKFKGLKPVAEIQSVDEYGPCLGWTTHWAEFEKGTQLWAKR